MVTAHTMISLSFHAAFCVLQGDSGSGEEEGEEGYEVVGGSAVGVHAGGEALPPAAQRALYALKGLQVRVVTCWYCCAWALA